MFYPANIQKLFSGVMITVFASMLILGVAGPVSADGFIQPQDLRQYDLCEQLFATLYVNDTAQIDRQVLYENSRNVAS